MITTDDQVDAIGTLAILSANTYLNTYKAILPLIEITASGAATTTYNKDDILTLDTSAVTFTYFGYKNYTSTGVLNPRTNEAHLLVNTGSSAVNKACPGGVCPQYVDIGNTAVTWPTNVDAHSAKIVFWNNAPNILRRPVCSFNTSAGSIPNGDPVTLSWNITNTLTNVLTEPTATGGTNDISVSAVGSGVFYPPQNDAVNHYSLAATNDIGTSTCTADITTQNQPPVPSPLFLTGSEDMMFSGTMVATDSSGDTIYFEKFGDPIQGTVSVDGVTGITEYTPNPDFCGSDTFEWRTFDQFLRYSDVQIASITVICTNDIPVAIDDTMNATGGVLATFDVLANDTDIDSGYEPQTFSITGVDLPANGILAVNGTQFEYTPDFAYMGPDSFTYTITDQSGATSNTGTVYITVAPGSNFAPVVSSGSFSVSEDMAVMDILSGSDINGDVLSFSATTLPLHGALAIIGSGFTYTPDADYNGSDSFDFVANDGLVDSSGATISFTVTAVQDAPVVVNDTVTAEMNTDADIDVLANDTDADEPYGAQTLTITGFTAPTSGTASIVGNKIRYTPNSLYLGPDMIEYVIEDQDGNLSNTGILNITVSTTNQAPIADSGSFVTTEDVVINNTLSGSDPDLTPVTFVLDADVSNGTLLLGSTGAFTYTPDADYNGSDSFTFHVTDGIFDSSTETVTLTITAENDAPTAVADSFTVAEDGTLDTTPLGNDIDPDMGDSMILVTYTQASSGSVVASGNLLTYTPIQDYCGTDTFSYSIQDLSGSLSNTGIVTMTVTCMNDAPTASGSSYNVTGNIATDSGYVLSGTLVGLDIDGDVLTYVIDSTVATGSLVHTGITFSYTPPVDFTGAVNFTFHVSDGTLSSSTETIDITVQPNNFNTAPLAYSDSFTTPEDTPIIATLSGYDLEGAPLTYILDTNVTQGVLMLSSTGAFTYTPTANTNGSDSFTFHVSDGVNDSLVVTGSISITAVNDLPVANNDSATGTEDSVLVISPITNDTDVEGGALTLSTFTNGANGSVSASGNSLVYTPTANACGADSVNYSITDPLGGFSNTGIISISLTCVNDAPIATSETVSATEDTALTIAVLANDTDVESSTLSIANLTQPGSGGTVAVVGTGVVFTPTANACSANPVTFTYQARDTALALSAVTTVTISTINCVNDTPTSASASYSMTGNVVINAGTMLSGGSLTGYVATSNTLIRSLASGDIEGDTVTFSGIAFPTHGTGTLSATGLFTYIPTPAYTGNDSMTFNVTDGTGTSTVYTITLVVQDPNPPVVTPPTSGPGGGGGGSQSFPTVPLANSLEFNSAPVSPTATSTGLVSQLLLSKRSLSGTTLPVGYLLNSYVSFIAPIHDAVVEAQSDQISSADRAMAIRQSGQRLMHSITRSLILSASQKSEVLQGAQSDLTTLRSLDVPSRESRALAYILRLISRERVKINQGVEVVKYLLSL